MQRASASRPGLIVLAFAGVAVAMTAIHLALAADSRISLRALSYIADGFVLLAGGAMLLLLHRNFAQREALHRERKLRHDQVHAEQNRLDEQVAQRTRELRELTQHVHVAREDERGRLARDLHDELGALLTSAKLDAARIRARLGDANPEAQERLAHLVGMLNDVIALKRRITEDLRPSTLGHLGLTATLTILARDFAERSGTQVHCALDEVQLPASAEIVVYRLVQEAITNITKHARAPNVWLTLHQGERQIDLDIRDDGVGFDADAAQRSRYGLVGMRVRVEAEGGTMKLRSTRNVGTEIRVRLPRAASSASA